MVLGIGHGPVRHWWLRAVQSAVADSVRGPTRLFLSSPIATITCTKGLVFQKVYPALETYAMFYLGRL
jgi:hypothetical protein